MEIFGGDSGQDLLECRTPRTSIAGNRSSRMRFFPLTLNTHQELANLPASAPIRPNSMRQLVADGFPDYAAGGTETGNSPPAACQRCLVG
jgi:hypothetical protein